MNTTSIRRMSLKNNRPALSDRQDDRELISCSMLVRACHERGYTEDLVPLSKHHFMCCRTGEEFYMEEATISFEGWLAGNDLPRRALHTIDDHQGLKGLLVSDNIYYHSPDFKIGRITRNIIEDFIPRL